MTNIQTGTFGQEAKSKVGDNRCKRLNIKWTDMCSGFRLSIVNVVLVFCMVFSTGAYAQHERLYTQFMFNKMAINPAYAGTYDGVAVTAFYRRQWIGFEGAPTTIGVNVDGSLKKDKVGLGLNVVRHTVGIFDQWTADGIYSYKMRMGPKSTLSAGLQGSVRYFGANFQDSRLRSSQGLDNDPAIPTEEVGRYLLNFGFGLYFNSEHFFVGVSMPRLLNSNIDFVDRPVPLSQESRHSFVMAGVILPLNEQFELIPQIMLRHVPNAPLSMDINAGIMYQKRLNLAVSYRTGGLMADWGDSIDFIAGAQISSSLFLGVSYDLLLSSLRNHNSGSAEIVLRYSFEGSVKAKDAPVRVINPRYF
jgi:type IX secretion system PorP/SprF family membrane protein